MPCQSNTASVAKIFARCLMSRLLSKEDIFELSVDERLCLIESLWDSIAPGNLSLPDSHRRALDDALAEYESDSAGGRSWDAIRSDLLPK